MKVYAVNLVGLVKMLSEVKRSNQMGGASRHYSLLTPLTYGIRLITEYFYVQH